MPKKRDFSAFDSIQHLELEDKAAEKLRRKQSVKDVAKAKAARSQTKIYGHLMESRILLQRKLQQVGAQAENNDTSGNAQQACDDLLEKLLQARRQLMGWNLSKSDSKEEYDETKYQKEYDECRYQWKEVFNRRHQDLRLHAGLASTSKTQFRVLDSSFWQQVESTVAHEEMRQLSTAENAEDDRTNTFEDNKVYQQMLKDFLVTAANTQNGEGGDSQLPQRWKSPKTKKQVDRKASKGRKIRYVEIPKLLNFTFPISKESKTSLNEDEWFQSLFGGAASHHQIQETLEN